jgi:hypothetical protein
MSAMLRNENTAQATKAPSIVVVSETKRRMTSAEWFVVGIAALELGAAAMYAWQRRFTDMVIWFGVCMSNVAWVCKVVTKQ